MTPDEQFFYQHAGYSRRPGESAQHARQCGARRLARAEQVGRRKGLSFNWTVDRFLTSADWIASYEDGGRDRNPWCTWQCVMYDRAGQIVNSLHGIDFGRDGKPWNHPHMRVIQAELALEQ